MKIHFATYSNIKNNHLNRYQSSCFHNNIQPVILGIDDKSFNFKKKIIAMENLAKSLNDNDILVFTDCWDVIILDNKITILNKFLSLNVPHIISAEKCKMCLDKYAYDHWINEDKNYPYLNSGSYMGYVKQLKIIFELFRKNNYFETTDDQTMFYALCVKYPEFKIMDYKQEIFGNNSGCKFTNFGLKYIDNTFKRIFTKKYAMFDEFKLNNNRLINQKTNTQSLILHCPGRNYIRLDYLAFKLGYSNSFFNQILLFFVDKIMVNLILMCLIYYLNFYFKIIFLTFISFFNKQSDNLRRYYIGKFSYYIL